MNSGNTLNLFFQGIPPVAELLSGISCHHKTLKSKAMKNPIKILALILTLILVGCSKDDTPAPGPIAQPEPEPENQAPSSFTVDLENSKNTARLTWTEAVDPDGDSVIYKIMLGDSLVSEQGNREMEFSNLLFEQEYQGKIIADDGNNNTVETPFNFTTGFLWLIEYEQSNGAGNGYTYEYDVSERLMATIIPSRDERNSITYDNQGRLSSYDEINYSYNNNGLVNNITRSDGLADMSLQYDNQDRVNIVLVNRTLPANNYEARVFINYYYDNEGNLESVNRERRYSSNNTNGTIVQYSGVNLKYDTNGNMTEIIFTRSEDGEIYASTGTRQVFTYDTKKSPTYTLLKNQIKLNSQIFLGGKRAFDHTNSSSYNIEQIPFTYNRSVHNTTNSKLYLDGELRFETNWEYDYNASGYPVSARRTQDGDDSQAFFPRWSYDDGN
jgi:YD repeat-containing protein